MVTFIVEKRWKISVPCTQRPSGIAAHVQIRSMADIGHQRLQSDDSSAGQSGRV
jgi:hypothetical protein